MTENNFILKLQNAGRDYAFDLTSPSIIIGTGSAASIHLPHGASDERHCRIERKDENQFVIRDLRSSTGTFVNGTKVLEAFLRQGDMIKINELTFEFTVKQETLAEQDTIPLKSKNSKWNEKLEALPNLAKTDYPVLLLGASGSGKEVLAKALHTHSNRAFGPFLSVNCSALSENLIESELFGHLKGSFTGSINDRKGAFEAARGGTLFLDEIGDLPYSLQAKLLRAIENNEIRPVGSDRVIKTDLRIIAATHQNLQQKIIDKGFRSDLFYRLNVITLNVPSLSERMEDFDDIFFYFCKQNRIRFSFQAGEILKKHNWPGNIRELRNVISRAAALYQGKTIEEKMALSLLDQPIPNQNAVAEILPVLGSKTNLIKEMERQMIISRLIANKGNQRKTANDLGMPKSTLHDRIRSYRIDLEKLEAELAMA